MTRSVDEWIGLHDDQRIPDRVRVRVFQNAEGECSKCGHKFMTGEYWQIDHAKPLEFGGEHRENNLRLLCLTCHDKKTAGEAGIRAKSNRIRAKHIGIRKPRTIRAWRKFDGTIVRASKER